jgi:hypothetical protein
VLYAWLVTARPRVSLNENTSYVSCAELAVFIVAVVIA